MSNKQSYIQGLEFALHVIEAHAYQNRFNWELAHALGKAADDIRVQVNSESNGFVRDFELNHSLGTEHAST